jgi:predicted metalloendopeptidase
VKQYGRYKIARPPMPVKGKPTLRENLADNGGVSLAFEAFRSVSPEPVEAMSGIGTLTHAQLFFVAFAQNFCEKTTDAYLRYIQSRSWNRYPPNRFRVIGSLANSPDFAVAFGCPVGSPMNPRRECRVW